MLRTGSMPRCLLQGRSYRFPHHSETLVKKNALFLVHHAPKAALCRFKLKRERQWQISMQASYVCRMCSCDSRAMVSFGSHRLSVSQTRPKQRGRIVASTSLTSVALLIGLLLVPLRIPILASLASQTLPNLATFVINCSLDIFIVC